MLLARLVAPWAKKPCQMGSKYTCQIWQKYGKKLPKNAQNWPYLIKTAPILANGGVFLTFGQTLPTHQNDYRGLKRGKVAFLEFNFEHFKG